MEKSVRALAQCKDGERYHYRFWQRKPSLSRSERNFVAVRALDFLICGAINKPRLPADRSIPNQFFCVRCDQSALATRRHELNVLATQSQTHEGIPSPCDIGAGIFGTLTKFCLPAVCCHVTGYLRTNSQNVLRPGCGKAVVSMSVLKTICW